MSVSVSFSNRNTLGSAVNVDMILMYMREMLTQLQNQANTQGAELDWSRARIAYGEDYWEENSFDRTRSLHYPTLEINVRGEVPNGNDPS